MTVKLTKQIVQRPGGGPPVVTKSTTRTYTRPDEAKVIVADPSAIPLSTAADPIDRDFANVPTGPGAVFSDNQSVVEGPPVAGQPTTKTVTEVVESDPAGAPMDTKTTSVTKTTGARPAGSAGTVAPPPPASAANIPGAGKPGKAPKDKPVFDTNHPKPITTVSNVPNAPVSGPVGPQAPAPQPPVLVEADPGPSPMVGAPGPPAGAAPPPAVVATPAPSGGKVGGLRWEPHLPTQARPSTPKYVSVEEGRLNQSADLILDPANLESQPRYLLGRPSATSPSWFQLELLEPLEPLERLPQHSSPMYPMLVNPVRPEPRSLSQRYIMCPINRSMTRTIRSLWSLPEVAEEDFSAS